MYLITFYVPESDAETVKEALFGAGAGKYNKYDRCSWETSGTGQFRPLKGSNPYLGKLDTTEKVKELRVEMICDNQFIKDAVKALINTHPYEEPAYNIIKMEDLTIFKTLNK